MQIILKAGCVSRLLLLMVLPDVVQAQNAYSTNADGSIYTYSTNTDGTVNIVAYAGPPWVVTIPAAINNLPVTSIGVNAFFQSSVTSMTIPDSVTTLGNSAFEECYSLTSVTMSNSVTYIGNSAFWHCTSLTNITIPNSVTNIDQYAFDGCSSLTNVSIPNSVTNIGMNAFYDCSSLTNVTIGNGVTNIGEEVFGVCSSLTSVTIGKGVTSIGLLAFYDCLSLTNVTIPNNVTSIDQNAFEGCVSLEGVYFQGNAPTVYLPMFTEDRHVTTYYLPAASGWSNTFWRPTPPAVLWNPQANNDASFGVQSNQFGFNITGNSNLVVVVESCTNLANPIWSPVSTNTLNTFIGTNGISYFSDPLWTNYPCRFYGFSWP
jgi:hypothetical protein